MAEVAEPVMEHECTPLGEIAAAVGGARAVYDSGRTRPASWRLKQVAGVLACVQENEAAIHAALRADLGKTPMDCLIEMSSVHKECKLVLSKLEEWMKPETPPTPLALQPSSSRIIYEPLGVLAIIAPWNFPFMLALQPLVGMLAAGNCVVMKPSEVAPRSASLMASLLPRYVDSEAVRFVLGGVPETTELLKCRFDHILYTGNAAVARIVSRAAAQYLTPVTLELGGKSPAFVDRSANLAVAARRIVSGKFGNSGQVCIAPDYLLVHESVVDDLLAELQSTLAAFYGDAPEKSADLSRIINSRHFDRVASMLEEEHGGRVICGGLSTADRRRLFIAPTLLLSPALDSRIMQEEIFGPVLPIIPVPDMKAGTAIVLAREKPLALYIFASNKRIVEDILATTSSGGVCINDTLFHIATHELPFGGVGESGSGAYHGLHSFKRFSHARSVLDRATWLDPGARYPPHSKAAVDRLRTLLQAGEPNTKKLAAYAIAAVGLLFFVKQKARL